MLAARWSTIFPDLEPPQAEHSQHRNIPK